MLPVAQANASAVRRPVETGRGARNEANKASYLLIAPLSSFPNRNRPRARPRPRFFPRCTFFGHATPDRAGAHPYRVQSRVAQCDMGLPVHASHPLSRLFAGPIPGHPKSLLSGKKSRTRTGRDVSAKRRVGVSASGRNGSAKRRVSGSASGRNVSAKRRIGGSASGRDMSAYRRVGGSASGRDVSANKALSV